MGEVVNRLVPVPAAGRRKVTARLVAPVGWYTDVDGVAEAVTGWSTTVAGDGSWTLDLPPNASFEAADTWYQIVEPGARHACVVPTGPGPFELHDITIVDPAAPPCCPPPPAGATIVRSLDDLDDVTGATTATPGQALLKQVSGLWQPATITGGDALAGQIRLTAVAATNLSGHRMVTPRPDGTLGYASNTEPTHLHAPLWMTLGAATAGATVEVLCSGPASEPSWSWSTGPLWLGEDGYLTRTPPVAPFAVFVAQVGAATGVTTAVIDRQPSIVLT